MNIPKTFKLGSRTWTVKRKMRATKWYGRTHSHSCKIELSTLNKTPEEELHTFYHELFHAIATTMGDDKLNNNESKIDALGNLLAQFMTTAD